MTLNNIYFSKDVLSKLIGIRFKDPSKSYSVFKYVQRINQELEFFSREIEKLREKSIGFIKKGFLSVSTKEINPEPSADD